MNYDRGNAVRPAVHPKADDSGGEVTIRNPHHASTAQAWTDPKQSATVLPGGAMPAELHGVLFAPWRDAPHTSAGWNSVEGLNNDLDEPPMKLAAGKSASSGVVIQEPDGRVWLIHPTNGFGGYRASFPKGKAEPELSLQANAIKECFEECGLHVEITGMIGDFVRTTSVARLYRTQRLGGTPADMGWETQAVTLSPISDLYRHLNHPADHPVAEALGTGAR